MPLVNVEENKRIWKMKQTLHFEKTGQKLKKGANWNMITIREHNEYYSKPRVEKQTKRNTYLENTKDIEIKSVKSITLPPPPEGSQPTYFSSCSGGGGGSSQNEFYRSDGSFDLEGSRSAHGHGWNN